MIQHPLPEKIGDPDLLVGREKEFGILNKWLDRIPKRLGKSKVILARRKSGSFHDVVESKIAPMLVTGSYVGWLIAVIEKYLQAGHLKRRFMNPYLTPEEDLQAVFKYAEFCNEPITNETDYIETKVKK